MIHLFHLKGGEILLATLSVYATDQPWFYAHFSPTPTFAKVEPLFEEELRLAKAKDWSNWEKANKAIREAGLYLLDLKNGNRFDQFILHIDGMDKARFRSLLG